MPNLPLDAEVRVLLARSTNLLLKHLELLRAYRPFDQTAIVELEEQLNHNCQVLVDCGLVEFDSVNYQEKVYHSRPVPIFVNGKVHQHDGGWISYEQVCSLAQKSGQPTVSWYVQQGGAGILSPGHQLFVHEGLIFNCHNT